MSVVEECYIIRRADGFEFCHPKLGFVWLKQAIPGGSLKDRWSAMTVRIVRVDEGSRLAEADCPWMEAYVIVVRRPARSALENMMGEAGEFLDLDCGREALWLFNCTTYYDCLEENLSDIVKFKDGRIMYVSEWVLRRSKIGASAIFKIGGMPWAALFCSQAFVDSWEQAGLKGLRFDPVQLA